MGTYEHLTLDVSDYVATVTVDRPPANALNMALYREIAAVFTEVSERMDDVRVAIVTGAGKYFCAGRDMKTADSEPQEKRNATVRAAFGAVYHCAVPVIAAVNGPALGGGFTLAIECDIILASDKAQFGLPEINIGLCGGIAEVTRGLNQYRGRRLYFTGEFIDAHKLHEWGMVDEVTTPAELMPKARKLALTIASKSPIAIRTAKWNANEVEKIIDHEQAYRAIESRATLGLAQTEDHKEAVRAWAEKRTPVFKGR